MDQMMILHRLVTDVVQFVVKKHFDDHGHENVTVDWDSIKWDELTPEERFNCEHIRMHQKHAGHAEMHESMIRIHIVVLIVSQVCLVQWKKWRPYSYHVCTLAGMISYIHYLHIG